MLQVIAGLIEHRLGEHLMAYYNQPLLASLSSFVSRIINSYWGTQVCHFCTLHLVDNVLVFNLHSQTG
jgi:hypothetical protein